METIRSLLDQIEITKRNANVNLAKVAFAMRAGFSMRKTQAKEELPRLYRRLEANVVPAKLVGLVATGDAGVVEKVAAFVDANGGVVLDASRLYQRIADRIEPSFGPKRHFADNQFMGLKQEAEKISEEVAGPVVAFEFKALYLKTRADTIAHVRRTIRGTMTDTLNVAVLTRSVTDQVVSKNLADEEKLPVVLVGALPEERPALRAIFSKMIEFDFPADFDVSGGTIGALFGKAS